jgi:hypothetical protein
VGATVVVDVVVDVVEVVELVVVELVVDELVVVDGSVVVVVVVVVDGREYRPIWMAVASSITPVTGRATRDW